MGFRFREDVRNYKHVLRRPDIRVNEQVCFCMYCILVELSNFYTTLKMM